MRLFEISPHTSTSGVYVSANHKWAMPGIKCPTCGTTWANTGLAYPGVDLSVLPGAEEYQDGCPVTPDQFENLKSKVLSLIPHTSLVLPGTEFGPLMGDIEGRLDQAILVWVNPWTLLIRRDAQEYLRNFGVLLPMSSDTGIIHEGKLYSTFVELQIEACASMLRDEATEKYGTACSTCGYRPMLRPERIVMRKESLPDDVDLFRPRELTTLILATERFIRAFQDVDKPDFVFKEVHLG